MVVVKLFVVVMLVAVAQAQEASDNKPAPAPVEVLTEKSFVRQDGYDFEFKTSDGSSRKEEANLITVGDHQGIAVKGSYSYITPDGQEYEVTFTADDKGYKPQIRTVPQGGQ